MFVCCKIFSKVPVQLNKINHLKYSTRTAAWQISSYGGADELQFNDNVKTPILKSKDVLVEMKAVSVNPIDVAMLGGYGNVVLNSLRQLETCSVEPVLEFPLTLGRDFCGKIVAKGPRVTDLNIDDVVYGVIQPHKQGSFSKLILADSALVHKKPSNISDEEAAGVLYTGLTAWSALQITAALGLVYPRDKRVLVLGASGGVGTMAVQLLKAWDIEVVTTCSGDAKDLVTSLNPNLVIDYNEPEAMHSIAGAGPYDVILDAAGIPLDQINSYLPFLKTGKFSKFVTLRSPFLKNTDSLGLVPGLVKNAFDLLKSNFESGELCKTNTIRWGFFMPIPYAVKEINKFIERGQIKPVIDSKYNFCELPTAFEKVQQGHLRGKIILNA
ncbi:reticulon-4-interacting protein 1 homolog, mitochondrial [Diaphorina citri]|jgi:NADPH:quinone reductase and related Zn-dependent oxidoreductases|uniref:Reticulon-4-interacting protein 1 homolog, mitochondrial n=1 Tax=Diaphorina citri TaxID=121845 RepID=A0A1S3DUI9_DIACI|nr:reticulon-4-interacting protein 1 homolog, mitochondrial [Diaphorina citri]KAI5701742.1 hypothetical protein M8J75_012844 [Diaphorina citri]KAI5729854.1 hypothetical protein M8J76_007312 [Diaphorina citri]KAI5733955.1 hypothetical protein M8J77_000733 [Diaphorina citri]